MGCGLTKPVEQKKMRRSSIEKDVDVNDYYEIDHYPVFCDGNLHLCLQPQNVILIINLEQDRMMYNFRLKQILQMSRYREFVDVVADQILVPLAGVMNCNPDDIILRLWKGADIRCRTLVSQYEKMWQINGDGLILNPRSSKSGGWGIQMVHSEHWQTHT